MQIEELSASIPCHTSKEELVVARQRSKVVMLHILEVVHLYLHVHASNRLSDAIEEFDGGVNHANVPIVCLLRLADREKLLCAIILLSCDKRQAFALGFAVDLVGYVVLEAKDRECIQRDES